MVEIPQGSGSRDLVIGGKRNGQVYSKFETTEYSLD
jgi:hypothetical protein